MLIIILGFLIGPCSSYIQIVIVNNVFNLKSSVTLIAKFKYNNNLILSDILDYNLLSDN